MQKYTFAAISSNGYKVSNALLKDNNGPCYLVTEVDAMVKEADTLDRVRLKNIDDLLEQIAALQRELDRARRRR